MDNPEGAAKLHPAWHEVVERLRELPADSPAWDGIDDLLKVIRTIASAKTEERRQDARHRWDLFLGAHQATLEREGFAIPEPDWPVILAGRTPSFLQGLVDAETVLARLVQCNAQQASTYRERALIGKETDELLQRLEGLLSAIPVQSSAGEDSPPNHRDSPLADIDNRPQSPPTPGETVESSHPTPAALKTSNEQPEPPPVFHPDDHAPETVIPESELGLSDRMPVLEVQETPYSQSSENAPPNCDLSPLGHACETPENPQEQKPPRKIDPALLPSTLPPRPSRVEDLQTHCQNHWISIDTGIAPCPWLTDPSFPTRLRESALAKLFDSRFAQSWILCKALDSLGQPIPVHMEDIESIVAILASPNSLSIGQDPGRAQRIMEATTKEARYFSLLLTLALHVVRPCHESKGPLPETDQVFKRLPIECKDLEEVLRTLYELTRQGRIPFEEIAVSRTKELPLSTDSAKDQFHKAKEEFNRFRKSKWTATGGNIVPRRHCQEAWQEFVRDLLMPLENNLVSKSLESPWDFAGLRKQIKSLLRDYAKIADRHEVKYKDRRKMDREVQRIEDLASRILDAAEASIRSERTGPSEHAGIPIDAIQKLITDPPLKNTSEEFLRMILQEGFRLEGTAQPSRNPSTSLSWVDILEYPDLLGLLFSEDAPPDMPSISVPVDSARDPRRIAALFVTPPRIEARELWNNDNSKDANRHLTDLLNERARFDLLEPLLSTQVLDSREKDKLHRELTEQRENALQEAYKTLESTWRNLSDMGDPTEDAIKKHFTEVSNLLEKNLSQLSWPLVEHWLESVTEFANKALNQALEKCRARARCIEDEGQKDAILAEIENGRYAEAICLLDPTRRIDSTDVERKNYRETMWRHLATEKWPHPKEILQAESTDEPDEANDLISQWFKTNRDIKELQELRKLFYEYISPEKAFPRKKIGVRPGAGLRDIREFKPEFVVVKTTILLEWLDRSQLNPCFLPQMHNFSELLILSYPKGTPPRKFVDSVTSRLEEYPKALAIFLAPTETNRNDIAEKLRQRKFNAAIVDDLDICRLVAPGVADKPNALIGLMEIAFEQLDWSNLSPFGSEDGQRVKRETFVGRANQAADLAETARYSRLFSGRKLGKSALLRYIDYRYSGTPLSSGKELRVLYVVAGGGEYEEYIVDRILQELQRVHPDFVTPEDKGETASERLAKALHRFILQYPNLSLLIILDEADSFVDDQLDAYNKRQEKCLSYQMMKVIPNQCDENNIPRVRFILSGYRSTNTPEGTWANAGDVMYLEPLIEADATNLIAGPLARLGIDARDQAYVIARRCGYQPAVILRFGDVILRLISRRPEAISRKNAISILSEHVHEALQSREVQDEIVTVIHNNFQGNPVGDVVFCAFLLALRDHPSGLGLDNAPSRVLEQIREVDENPDWLSSFDPDHIREIQRHLKDFVNRQLLVHHDQTGQKEVYGLKFPHHLPLLLSRDPKNRIRKTLTGLRDRPGEEVSRNLLPHQIIMDVEYSLRFPRPNPSYDLAVVASHWPKVIQAHPGGVAYRLAIRERECIDFADGTDHQVDILQKDTLVGLNVSPEIAATILRERSPDKRAPLLLGNVDLYRWAVRIGNDPEHEVCCHGTWRLRPSKIQWWYEKNWECQFGSPDASARIHAITSGIPFLLGHFDRILRPEPGRSISEQELVEYLEQFEVQFNTFAKDLTTTGSPFALAPREIEILAMTLFVSKYSETFNVKEELGSEWDKTYAEEFWSLHNKKPDSLFAKDEAADSAALVIIRGIGLAPLDNEFTAYLPSNDILHRLLKEAGPIPT